MTKRIVCGKVHAKHGTEGPKHDPYSYTEYSFTTTFGEDVEVHVGLAEYVIINGRRYINGLDALKTLCMTLEEIEDVYKDQFGHCKCGSDQITGKLGFPGEVMFVCEQCGATVDTHFNEAAVM